MHEMQLYRLTLDMTDLELLCVRQSGDVDLCTRALLQETHIPALFPNQTSNKVL